MLTLHRVSPGLGTGVVERPEAKSKQKVSHKIKAEETSSAQTQLGLVALLKALHLLQRLVGTSGQGQTCNGTCDALFLLCAAFPQPWKAPKGRTKREAQRCQSPSHPSTWNKLPSFVSLQLLNFPFSPPQLGSLASALLELTINICGLQMPVMALAQGRGQLREAAADQG